MSLLTQMRGFIFLLHKSSRRSSINRLTAHLYKPFKRYSQEKKEHSSHVVEEVRAPSTAQEFKRVAEEKLRAAEQRVASQTSDKVYEGAEEASIGDSKLDSIKNRSKEHEAGSD